jgi:sugar phosphate isomerase/epimerase
MKIAAQLYTFLDLEFSSLEKVASRLHSFGCDGVEIRNHRGKESASELRGIFDTAGLSIDSVHLGYDQFLPETIGKTMEYHDSVGVKTLVLPYAPLSIFDNNPTKMTQEFRRMDETLAKNGFRFAYHNHAFEFQDKDETGKTQFERLLEDTNVSFQIDVYWIKTLNLDLLSKLQEWKSRICSLHIKDLADDGKFTSTPIGAGCIDWKPIVALAKEQNWDPLIIELEDIVKDDPMDWMEQSIAYLKKVVNSL